MYKRGVDMYYQIWALKQPHEKAKAQRNTRFAHGHTDRRQQSRDLNHYSVKSCYWSLSRRSVKENNFSWFTFLNGNSTCFFKY